MPVAVPWAVTSSLNPSTGAKNSDCPAWYLTMTEPQLDGSQPDVGRPGVTVHHASDESCSASATFSVAKRSAAATAAASFAPTAASFLAKDPGGAHRRCIVCVHHPSVFDDEPSKTHRQHDHAKEREEGQRHYHHG